LDALDAIHPTDLATLQTRELAAMNLASELGQIERAKTAARRLFGMRLDHDTEMALAQQLSQLGMPEMATAVLQRSRRRGGKSTQELLALAKRFASAGDKEAAAEVAFGALRKLQKGRNNQSHYRQQAVQILKSAGRLEKLLKQAEKRVASAPKSVRLKLELADLYTAAERKEDADRMFEEITKLQPNDAGTLWRTGQQLYRAKKYGEAIDKFLAAIEREPSRLQQGYWELQNAARQGKQTDKVYRAMIKMDLKQIQPHVLSNMLSMRNRDRTKKPSEAATEFVDHLLKNAPAQSFGQIFRQLTNDKKLLKSKGVTDAIERVFADKQIFDPSSPFLQRVSYSSEGLMGPLKPCLMAIEGNEEVTKRVRDLVVKHAEADEKNELPRLIVLMIDSSELSIEQIESKVQPFLDNQKSLIPYTVWWEFGQLVAGKSGHESLVVKLLEHAKDNVTNQRINGYQYSVDAQLTNSYIKAGMNDKARVGLLREYRETDNSQQNQHNPGYGDYQDLTSYLSIGKKFLSINDRLNTIRIYSDALSQPQRFEAAKKWGGRQNFRKQFEDELGKTMDQLSDSECIRFLTFDRDHAEEDAVDSNPQFDLIRLTASPSMDPELSSIAALVVDRVGQSKKGKEKLTEFYDVVSDKLKEFPDDWSLLALRVLISDALELESAAAALKTIVDKFPATDDKRKIKQSDQILALYSPALMALESDHPAVVAEAGKLANRISLFASSSEKTGISATLNTARIKSGGDGVDKLATYQQLLDLITPKTNPPRAVPQETAIKCLELAETAAGDGVWSVAIDALHRGFGGGPPLNRMVTTRRTASAFTTSRARRQISTSTSQNQANSTKNIDRVVAVLERMPLQQQTLDDEETLATTDLVKIRFNALLDMVLPEQRKTEVFPYCVNLLVDSAPADLYVPDTPSLAGLLAEDAIESGRVAEFRERLQSRNRDANPSVDLQLMSVYLAIAEQDQQQLETALSQLAQLVAAEGKKKRRKTTKSTTSRLFALSAKKPPEHYVNNALHGVLAAHARFGAIPPITSLENQLLQQASDSKTLGKAGATWSWIATRMIQDKNNTDEQAQAAIDSLIKIVQKQFSSSRTEIRKFQVGSAKPGLAIAAVRGNRWDVAANLYRSLERSTRLGYYPQEDDVTVAKRPTWSIVIAGLQPEQRYQLLSKIAFAKGLDTRLRMIHGIVNYTSPPASLGEVAPHLKRVQHLHLASPDLPIVSMAIDLADSAVECGRTDELIGRLKDHVKTPGDEADAMIGMTHLANGQVDAAANVLALVGKRLEESKPEEPTTDPMPAVSMIFVAQALGNETLRNSAQQIWKAIQLHAHYRTIGLANPLVARLTAQLDETITARETDSALEHWISVPIPRSYRPICETMESRFRFEDGTVHTIGGSENNALILKYPLEGDFQFQFRSPQSMPTESSPFYAGTSYRLNRSRSSVRSTSHTGRTSKDMKVKKSTEDRKNQNEVSRIEFDGDEIRVKIADRETVVDQRTYSMPTVGIFFLGNNHTIFSDIQITGKPKIPRRVDLINRRLRGWYSGLMPGALPDTELPCNRANTLASAKKHYSKRRTAYHKQTEWYCEDDELRTTKQRGTKTHRNPGNMRHILYIRPLLEGESFSFEFFFDRGRIETHPTIGRVALLLRESGVQLRWLGQATSLESYEMDPLHEVDPSEPIGDGVPKLKQNQWNRVKLTRAGDRVIVTINRQGVCRIPVGEDQRFGLLAENERQVQVKNAKLTGPWPKALPDDLMEKR